MQEVPLATDFPEMQWLAQVPPVDHLLVQLEEGQQGLLAACFPPGQHWKCLSLDTIGCPRRPQDYPSSQCRVMDPSRPSVASAHVVHPCAHTAFLAPNCVHSNPALLGRLVSGGDMEVVGRDACGDRSQPPDSEEGDILAHTLDREVGQVGLEVFPTHELFFHPSSFSEVRTGVCPCPPPPPGLAAPRRQNWLPA